MSAGILFLDDDGAQLVIYKVFVRDHLPETQVYFTKTVSEALTVLNENDISLVIVDLLIPTENGADLIMKMKNESEQRNTKIIVVTSTPKNTLIHHALKDLVDDFITKPINLNDFADTIARVLAS